MNATLHLWDSGPSGSAAFLKPTIGPRPELGTEEAYLLRGCRAFLSLFFFAFIALSLSSPAADAPLGSPDYRPNPAHPFGFRADGTGRFPAATPPTEWSATRNIRWSTAIGSGYASPILAGDFLIVASEPNFLTSLDRATGTVKWRIAIKPEDIADEAQRTAAAAYQPPKDGSGMAAATPVTDGTSIFAVFANGVVSSITLDGKRNWTVGVDAEQGTAYGRSASPLLVDGKLIIHLGHLYALDPATGRQLWANNDAKPLYGSPAIMSVAGTNVLITPNGDVVRVADGTGVNSDLAHASYASPVVENGVVYFLDQNCAGLRLDAKFKESTVWGAMLPGEVFGSALIHEGALYVVTGSGALCAFAIADKDRSDPLIDARSLLEGEGSPVAYGSLALAGKYLFFHSNVGDTFVLEATREAKLVSRNKLPAGSGASPIFSGSNLFLRGGDKVYCIGP